MPEKVSRPSMVRSAATLPESTSQVISRYDWPISINEEKSLPSGEKAVPSVVKDKPDSLGNSISPSIRPVVRSKTRRRASES